VTDAGFIGRHAGQDSLVTVRSRRFSGGALAARTARRAVREDLEGEVPELMLGDVELLVSELATNSVRHGGSDESGELAVRTEVLGEGVRVQVWDHGKGFEGETPQVPERGQPGGYGLLLLERMSDRWGVRRDDGFCVWFELSGSRPN
jgi:anti-sigma regulatory factor (Ser/Thr protein kinase)